jgi:DNA-binding winged helix-turn-helix (wHTH) protein
MMPRPVTTPVRFRFAEFVLSPRQRILVREGTAVPLIPKYFDLLVLLITRRREAVSKQTIFAEVWSDVVVSDGALSQAVRTLRRTLHDDSREPRFIRTVSRHGYQFVWADVIEENDDGALAVSARFADVATAPDRTDILVERLLVAAESGDADGRDLAERLHAIGTAEALASLQSRPENPKALALMREARWNVPGAGDVPLRGSPRASIALIRLRLADAGRMVADRWASASASGALAGAVAGAIGGIVLSVSPTSTAQPQAAIALAAIGTVAGGLGAAGIGAGLAAAEALARSRRELALVAGGAIGGAGVAAIAHLLLDALLDGLFGLVIPNLGGAAEGLFVGAAAGIGYSLGTHQPPGGGLAAPSGRRRASAVGIVGACCAVAAMALALTGRSLVGGIVHEIARSSRGAPLVLAPLGELIGDPGFGRTTRAILSAFEGATFGCSLAWGLTRRPASLGERSA